METYIDKNTIDAAIETFIQKNYRKLNLNRVTFSEKESFWSNKMLVIELIRAGIPYTLFQSISQNTPFTASEWSELLDLSDKSLRRYKETARRFKVFQSEKIIEMAEVTKAGMEVFNNLEQFKLWLATPCFGLGNQKPISLLKDSYGKDLVLGELTRMKHGIFA